MDRTVKNKTKQDFRAIEEVLKCWVVGGGGKINRLIGK